MNTQSISNWFRSLFNKSPIYVAPSSRSSLLSMLSLGKTGQLDAMSSTGTLFSIIDLLSTATAQVDWHLYRTQTDARRVYGPVDENRSEILRHQALRVIDRPNPMMTRMELFQRAQQHIDLAGESFWWVEKSGSIPVALWPIRPDRMTEAVNGSELIGWVYSAPGGDRVPYRRDEIIHIKTPDPMNMYRGSSPVMSLLVDLESTRAAAEYNRNFFRNSAQPSGIIRVKEQLGDTQFDRIATQWNERHKGVQNAHRVSILEDDMQFENVQVSMRDMQFVEMRNVSREMIREAYRIHKHMLGMADDVNRANAVAASDDFARWSVNPRLERIRLALNYDFLPMFGTTGAGMEFCPDDATPLDREAENSERDSKVRSAVALINAGGDPEDVLAAMGLPPIDWEKPEPLAIAPVSPGAPTEELTQEDVDMAARLLKEVFS